MFLLTDLLGLAEKDLDWYQMLTRAVIVFVLAMAAIRLSGMRTFGTQSAFDVVVSITLGGILGRCIMGHYPFFPSLTAAGALLALHRLAGFLAARSKWLGKMMEGEPVLVFKEGRREENILKKYDINEKELLMALHEESVDDFEKIKSIWLEPDGKLSVIKK